MRLRKPTSRVGLALLAFAALWLAIGLGRSSPVLGVAAAFAAAGWERSVVFLALAAVSGVIGIYFLIRDHRRPGGIP